MTTSDTEPRQIVLLCDGTNNNLTGQHKDTNVVKLCTLLAADPDPQRLVFYDPGVGNPGELPGATTWDQFRRTLDRVSGLAFGRGVYENMVESYLFLMRHYRPGDQIFIFGFSRGAFTARSVAGLVNLFGILRPHMESMVPTLLHVYFADRSNSPQWQAICEQTSRLFTDDDARHVDIHFVGVWDTVASVGMPPFSAKFTALPRPEGKCFVHIRQAMALDEHRSQFKPRLYARDNGPFQTRSGREGSLVQLWFPGAHCNVGGGYDAQASALSDQALAWLVSEAVSVGLRVTRQGAPEAGEAEVHRRLAAAYRAAPHRPLTVGSELQRTPLWALTGMSVRETDRVVMDDRTTVMLRPEAHASVTSQNLGFATSSPWATARTPGYVWITMLLIPVFMLALGQLLHGAPATGAFTGDVAAAWQSMAAYLHSNNEFQRWQLTGWLGADWQGSPYSFASPRWALVWDLALIACYATALSWFAARAFGRLAGLRRAGLGPRPWLNRLGWALPVMVMADVGEDVFSWLAITLGENDVVVLARLAHVLAAVLCLAKFVGLFGVVVLIGAGSLPLRPPDTQAAGTRTPPKDPSR